VNTLVMMRSERPRIRSDEAPPRMPRVSSPERDVLKMARGEWMMLTHAEAKTRQKIVKRLGGSSTVYRTSDMFWCFKVLDAPWMNGVCVAGRSE